MSHTYGTGYCDLQQAAAALRGGRNLIGIKSQLRLGALVVQQQAVDQWWDECACGRLACRAAVFPLSPALSPGDVHRQDVHEAARSACMTEQLAIHEGT